MDLNTLYHRCVTVWTDRVADVSADQWDRPTPCREWTVRDLVNHVTGEDRWTSPLMSGARIEEVGSRFDGDLLGDHPKSVALEAATEAGAAVDEHLTPTGTVHLSYGEESAGEYVHQLAADHLIHAWDLAVATDGDTALDPGCVALISAWFGAREDAYRSAGIIDPAVTVDGGAQDRLLGASGRDPRWSPNRPLLTRFSAAFGSGDVDAIMGMMTDDCHVESTGPAPDGVAHDGATAVRGVWDELFTGTREPRFTEEESFVSGDRGVLRWRFSWQEEDGSEGHVRGTDLLRFRDGRISETLSYVKG